MTASDLPSFSLEPVAPEASTGARQPLDPWAAQTELATRFVGRQEDQPSGPPGSDPLIGKAVGANSWELFVSCAPSDALAQQFETRGLRFMAVHGLGRISSLQFLAEAAGLTGAKVQRLVIRRQGFGTDLACLYFMDIETSCKQVLRCYASDVKADEATRMLLSRLLLSRADVVALVLGDMSGDGIDSSVGMLAQNVRDGRKTPVTLVALPFASAGVDAALASFARHPDLPLRRSARLARAADGWTFLASTWNGQCKDARPGAAAHELMLIPLQDDPRGVASPAAALAPAPGASPMPALSALSPAASFAPALAPVQPQPPAAVSAAAAGRFVARLNDEPAALPVQSAPVAPPAQPPVQTAAKPADSDAPTLSREERALQAQMLRHALAVSGLKGVHSCCIFHARTLVLQAQAGAVEPAAELLVRQGRVLIATMQAASQALGLGRIVREGVVAMESGHLLMHLVPGAPNMVLVVLLKVGSEAELSIFKSELNRLQQVVKSALAPRAA